ncbi:MAG: rRNA cytosine-C5-methylase [Propionibacteriaceae bacterium]|nr:rRNA cytosine-C5-methylase [Propionibacteriaceae bacterium]
MSKAPDKARVAAYHTLRDVTADGAYTNLALSQRLGGAPATDAAFVTELVNGTARALGTLDAIIEAAGGRAISTLQPAVVDVLRLGAYQGLRMRVPSHAAVATSVDLAVSQIGARTSGVVNAIMRRIVERTFDEWLDIVTAGLDEMAALALRYQHPRWIVEAFADRLPADELVPALEADNTPPRTTLAVRPGLMSRDRLVAETGGEATPYSPWGVTVTGDPAVTAVMDGRAGVQDEGSQLVVLAAAGAAQACGVTGPWLDLCAGPGGKTALLRGLAEPEFLVAAELQPHRAKLVGQALRGFDPSGHQVVIADGGCSPWRDESFGLVLADVPCSGLGSLRRRPEARWRRQPTDLTSLRSLQGALLAAAWASARPGGVVAYATCSPHRGETEDIVTEFATRRDADVLAAPVFLPDVPDCAATKSFVQLWPHRHGTDAMFLALLRKPS